jgi:hypothetical protein
MLRWWMRAVGVLYLIKFVAVVVLRAPVRGQAPDAIGLAAGGDQVAGFLLDTWVIFGLEMAALGVALLLASRGPERARALGLAIVAVEISGVIADVYQLARGHDAAIPVTWIAIHGIVIATGLAALRPVRTRSG